ncbi:DUF58 domain-containing protein [Actinomadura algeriensis]|uniref:Uncharacterized protein (DUF58 family) n=1 Tax=Actinomadura algeriensis TaxID=1679523 RepID=A0ABR9K0D3_9ACTN|nr:DUF58 domain-containing protein [Actinomadura algeriensis]MBE1536292.1 uncharacterized protein (DUF58 family) [Actinomadura algeriensis]
MTSAPEDGTDGERPAGPGGPARLAPERTLRRLELQVTRRLNGLLNGEHLGLLPGPGTELAEARLYQPGEDDVRHMDWAVTARTTNPHVRDLVADHELEAWALVDMTPSMDFGTADLIKRELAVAALAAVGFMTVRLGDRVGAYLLHGGGLRRWPARTGKAPFYALLQAVLDSRPHGPGTPPAAPPEPAGGRTSGRTSGRTAGTGAGRTTPGDLTGAIGALDRGQSRRGLRVIISDFLPSPDADGDPPPDARTDPDGTADTARPPWERPLRRLAARHQVLAVEIIDPRELELPDVGLVEMTDPETGAVHEIVLNRRVRDDYARAAAAQRARTRDALRRCGAHHLILRTDRDWIADIARFALRQRRAAGRPVTTAGVRP